MCCEGMLETREREERDEAETSEPSASAACCGGGPSAWMQGACGPEKTETRDTEDVTATV